MLFFLGLQPSLQIITRGKKNSALFLSSQGDFLRICAGEIVIISVVEEFPEMTETETIP